jgi:hypothetical protein
MILHDIAWLQMFRCAWPSLFQYHRDRDPVQAASFSLKVFADTETYCECCWSWWRRVAHLARRTITSASRERQRASWDVLPAARNLCCCVLVASCYSLCSLCPRRVGKDQNGRNMTQSMCYTKTIIRLSCFIWTHGIFGLELILPRLFSAQDRVNSAVPKVKQTKTHQKRQHLAISRTSW